MGILDELKREAEFARQNKSQEELRKEEEERVYREELAPRMIALHQFLIELVKLLEESGRPVTADYELPGIGKVENLAHGNYGVSIDSSTAPRKIVLSFECQAPQEKQYTVSPRKAADETSLFLREQKILFTEWPIRDGVGNIIGATFLVRPKVRVSIFFEADQENFCLYVISRNFEGIGTKHSRVGYQQFNEAWKDQLGRYLLRKTPHLFIPSITDEQRRALQARLALEKRRTEEDWTAPPEEDDKTANATGLFGGLRKILFKPAR
jgi:hypothetical protein